MARKSRKRSSKNKIPLPVLERRAKHLVSLVKSRGGHVDGTRRSSKRRAKHRGSR